MYRENQFMILEKSGYFYATACSTDGFIGCSTFNDVIWRVLPLPAAGYSVWEKKDGTWRHDADVAGLTSVFGILTDSEDEWIKRQEKEEKTKKRCRM